MGFGMELAEGEAARVGMALSDKVCGTKRVPASEDVQDLGNSGIRMGKWDPVAAHVSFVEAVACTQ